MRTRITPIPRRREPAWDRYIKRQADLDNGNGDAPRWVHRWYDRILVTRRRNLGRL